ncbi:hypothetical protein WG66_008858 [Moniliophthora roreri]|nr:hypothetical protein WG66_008858 [Moniliophthora roreri]
MFNEVKDVSISGNVAHVVHRDQYNQTTIINRIVRVERPGRTIEKRKRKRYDIDSEYNQYREIIRGDIYKLEQLFSEDRGDWEREDGHLVKNSYQRTIHRARVYGDDRVFTAISYRGQDAEKPSTQHSSFTFIILTSLSDPAVLLQLFAINRSKIPTLLFYDEWLPFGHLYSKVEGTFWEGYYLNIYTNAWARRMGLFATCKDRLTCPQINPGTTSNLWLNSRTSRVSLGPEGPYAGNASTIVLYNSEDMPSAMEMAKGNTCVRFFSKTGAGNLDPDVLQYAHFRRSIMPIENLLGIGSHNPGWKCFLFWEKDTCGPWRCHHCGCITCDEVRDFIGKLQFNSVYSGVELEKVTFLKESLAYTWVTYSDMLSDQTLIDSGLTRFQFNVRLRDIFHIHFHTKVLGKAWYGCRRPIGPSYLLVAQRFVFFLRMESPPEQFSVSALETLPIVYLFLRPPPPCLADFDSWMSQVSFWSFDKDGSSEIPETERKRLSLPKITFSFAQLRLERWSKCVYDGIHAWQVARGFDPTTANFARSLGMPTPQPAMTRFKEIVEKEPLTCNSLPKPDANSIHCDPDDPSASSQLSPLPIPSAVCIPQRQTPQKRKRVQVVVIHDTDSESEPEFVQNSNQLSTSKRKRGFSSLSDPEPFFPIFCSRREGRSGVITYGAAHYYSDICERLFARLEELLEDVVVQCLNIEKLEGELESIPDGLKGLQQGVLRQVG